jgi:NTP pyrophosphatase (non-canonical NTP hydrolase)
MNCPECGDEQKNAYGVIRHWGYQHDGEPPMWVKRLAHEQHPFKDVTGADHPATGNEFEHAESAKEKIRQSKLGEQNPAKRPEVAAKIAARLDRGGKKQYPDEWTAELRQEIRERDGYECQVCSLSQDELGQKLDVHHIDGDKDNCSESNLVSLCRSCHVKIESRKYWSDVQAKMAIWQANEYPQSSVWTDVAGIAEEFGELASTQIDILVGRQPDKFETNEDAMKDAIGDILVYLGQLASKHGLTLEECYESATEEVLDEESHHG